MTQSTGDSVIGTIGGTLISIIAINPNTLLTTIIVASIGATTSFFVSMFLKWCVKKIKKDK